MAELAAEEVAMEKGAGMEGKSPVVEAPAPIPALGRVVVGGRERSRGWRLGMSMLRQERSLSSSDTVVGTQVVPVIRVKGEEEGEEEQWSPSRFKEHATPRGSSSFY